MDLAGAAGLIGFSTLLAFNQVVVKLTNDGISPVLSAGLRSAIDSGQLADFAASFAEEQARGDIPPV